MAGIREGRWKSKPVSWRALLGNILSNMFGQLHAIFIMLKSTRLSVHRR